MTRPVDPLDELTSTAQEQGEYSRVWHVADLGCAQAFVYRHDLDSRVTAEHGRVLVTDLAALLAKVRAEGRRQGLEEAAAAMLKDGQDEGDYELAIDRRIERIRALADKATP